MKKQRFLSLAMALALSLGMFTMGALAASGNRTLEVTYKDIKLVIDGTEITPKDAAGNIVEPFVYNGTTYLPVRAVGEALGKEVSWDGSTNTVYVGAAAAMPYQANHADLLDGNGDDASFSVAGKNYLTGVVLYSRHFDSNLDEKNYGFNGDAIWNTEGYQSMTFTVGHVGDTQWNGTLYITLDGLSAGEYELTWDGSPKTITVSLNGSPNLKMTLVSENKEDIYKAGSKSYAAYGIFDISLS